MSGVDVTEACSCAPSDKCGYCGCCQHTPLGDWCKVNEAPLGMSCPNRDCGCEGRS